MALLSTVIVPAVAVKFAVVDPAATVAVPGTVSVLELFDRVTTAPPVPATLESVTVQVELAPVARLEGVHESELTVGVVNTRLTDADCEVPFDDAVTLAV